MLHLSKTLLLNCELLVGLFGKCQYWLLLQRGDGHQNSSHFSWRHLLTKRNTVYRKRKILFHNIIWHFGWLASSPHEEMEDISLPTPPTSWSFLLGHRDNFYCVQLLSKHFYQNPNSILENILNILNMVHGHHDMPLLFAVHFINKRMDSIFQIQQRPNFCPIFDENSCAHHCSSIFHLVTEAISLPISTVRSDFLKETFTSRLMMKGSMNTQPNLYII